MKKNDHFQTEGNQSALQKNVAGKCTSPGDQKSAWDRLVEDEPCFRGKKKECHRV